MSRDLSGSIDGDNVQFSSRYTERHGDSLMFTFSGKAGANEMSGSLDMGEYLNAKWTAKRHDYPERVGAHQPVRCCGGKTNLILGNKTGADTSVRPYIIYVRRRTWRNRIAGTFW